VDEAAGDECYGARSGLLDKDCLDDSSQAFRQVLELADLIGGEGLLARSTSPNPKLRDGRGRWIGDLVELPGSGWATSDVRRDTADSGMDLLP
jgi:hypothetical protein